MENIPQSTASSDFAFERDNLHLTPWCPLGRRNLLMYALGIPPMVLFVAHIAVFGAVLIAPLLLVMWRFPVRMCTCPARLRAQQEELARCLED